ncbi:MAG: hypothetical protein [Bacteriophage sp.]|nr:MAG: hypothetical protein [Bacteriophage sp.]
MSVSIFAPNFNFSLNNHKTFYHVRMPVSLFDGINAQLLGLSLMCVNTAQFNTTSPTDATVVLTYVDAEYFSPNGASDELDAQLFNLLSANPGVVSESVTVNDQQAIYRWLLTNLDNVNYPSQPYQFTGQVQLPYTDDNVPVFCTNLYPGKDLETFNTVQSSLTLAQLQPRTTALAYIGYHLSGSYLIANTGAELYTALKADVPPTTMKLNVDVLGLLISTDDTQQDHRNRVITLIAIYRKLYGNVLTGTLLESFYENTSVYAPVIDLYRQDPQPSLTDLNLLLTHIAANS